MAARNGNTYWKQRSKHGRDKIFSTPADMEAACEEYFEAASNTMLNVYDWVGAKAKKVNRSVPIPFTIKGLSLFLGVNSKYFNNFKHALVIEGEDAKQIDKDFHEVITRVEEIIQVQKFNGAVCNIYSATIVSQDLGMKNKSEVNVIAEQPLFPEEGND